MDVLDPEQDQVQDQVADRQRSLVVAAVAVVGALVAGVLIATQWPNTPARSPVRPVAATSGPDVVNGTPGHWVELPTAPGLTGAYITWTGSEILAGPVGYKSHLNPWKVFVYNSTTKKWRTALGPARLQPRTPYATVWDGSELLFLGGVVKPKPSSFRDFVGTTLSEAYNPTTNTWHRIADLPGNPEQTVSAVWTGTEVLAFSGDSSTYAYDATANTWRLRAGLPGGHRTGAVIAWTGTNLLVWGGLQGTDSLRDGWRYDPHTGAWSAMAPAPLAATDAASAWTGSQLFVWGGTSTSDAGATTVAQEAGYSYDPDTDSWTTLPAAPYHGLVGVTGTWTGDAFLIWGRQVGVGKIPGAAAGAAYDPIAGTWRTLASGSDDAGVGARAFWDENSMLVLGGWQQNETATGSSGGLAQWVPGP